MQKIPASWMGGLAISFAAILWGLDGVVLTPGLRPLDTGFVVMMLHFIPFVIMNLFLYKEYRIALAFTSNQWVNLFLIALFGGAAGTLFIVKALFLLEFKPLTVVVLLQKLQPVFAITLAAILLKERISRSFVLWASLALVAGYTLTFGLELPDFKENGNTLKASGYAILAAAAFGSSTVFSKRAVGAMSFRTATFFRYGLTSAIMLVYVAVHNSFTNITQVTTLQWGIFLIIAFTTGSGAIFLYYLGLIRVKAMVATMCELFFPISAILFDYLINGAVLTTVQWISAIIMVGAIIKLTISNNSSESR